MGDVKINSDSDLVKTALNETIRVLNLLEGEKRKLSVEELVPFLQAIVELRDDQKVVCAESVLQELNQTLGLHTFC